MNICDTSLKHDTPNCGSPAALNVMFVVHVHCRNVEFGRAASVPTAVGAWNKRIILFKKLPTSLLSCGHTWPLVELQIRFWLGSDSAKPWLGTTGTSLERPLRCSPSHAASFNLLTAWLIVICCEADTVQCTIYLQTRI